LIADFRLTIADSQRTRAEVQRQADGENDGKEERLVAAKSRNLQVWIEARKRHHLSHAQVQMARELGMNPKKLGKIDNHRQERWKAPLPQFIEHLYFKRFRKTQPDRVLSLEERTKEVDQKRREKKKQKRLKETSSQLDLRPPASPGTAAVENDLPEWYVESMKNVASTETGSGTGFGEVLEAAEKLTSDEQETLIDILNRRLADRRRSELAKDIQEAQQELQSGGCRPATADELINEILS